MDSTIMTVVTFVGALVAIGVPFWNATTKLNATIARLTEAVDNLEKNWESGHEDLKGRVNRHGEQIDELEKTAADHTARIKNLEER